jgi:hypothetical protein
MQTLADALESFNRKERNLLVRQILRQDGSLHLGQHFRKQVADKLGLDDVIPEKAWWATDYHISWLAGALALFVNGEECAKQGFKNPKIKDDRWENLKKPEGRQLVEGNQEDVDLVITTGYELILIEAKAYGTWTPLQLNSKLARLNLLHEFYSGMVRTEPAINFRLLLISPEPLSISITTRWPNWACKGQDIPWMRLEIDNRPSVFEVTRCDSTGARDADGGSWHIAGIPRRREPTASAGIV